MSRTADGGEVRDAASGRADAIGGNAARTRWLLVLAVFGGGCLTVPNGTAIDASGSGDAALVDAGPSGWIRDLNVGADTACAVVASGEVYCWGSNAAGALGVGLDLDELPYSSEPLRVRVAGGATLGTAVAVAMGQNFGCALLEDGTVACWGENDVGQLGDGSLVHHRVAAPVSNLDSVVRLESSGLTACAVRGDGALLCWGSDGRGELGNGEPKMNQPLPVMIPMEDAASVRTVRGGRFHSCPITEAGQLYCAGLNDTRQSGNVAPDGEGHVSTLVEIERSPGNALGGVVAVGGGHKHTCASTSSEVLCWGANLNGQLGNRETLPQDAYESVPVLVDFGGPDGTASAADDIAGCAVVELAGFYGTFGSTCGRCGDGRVVCWGAAEFGQLGNDGMDQSTVPVLVSGLDDAVDLDAGFSSACATRANDTIVCWGSNDQGQIGPGRSVGQSALEPVEVVLPRP